jgi:hypothetical protein
MFSASGASFSRPTVDAEFGEWVSDSARGMGNDQASAGEDLVFARRSRVVGLGAPLMVLAAAALFVIAVANVQVARGRNAVELHLDEANAAATAVPEHLASVDIEALSLDLDRLDSSSALAERGSSGFLWAVAGRANPGGGWLRTLRRQARDSVTLAAAATPLRASLTPLTGSDERRTAVSGNPNDPAGPVGPDELGQLDDLARGLSRYASAARAVNDPSAPALGRAALAAGLLPTLAGAEQPRTWTICRTETGPCQSATVTVGRLGPADSTAGNTAGSTAGRVNPRTRDLLVIGLDPDDVFRPAAAGQPRHWDVPTMFGLLDDLGPVPITVHSVVRVEQQAIDQLARPAR